MPIPVRLLQEKSKLVSKETVVLCQQASETLIVSYQREVNKGKLTAVASLEKLTFQA